MRTQKLISAGFAIVALAYGLGPISGGHVNPAVSLGVFLAGRMSAAQMAGILCSHIDEHLGSIKATTGK